MIDEVTTTGSRRSPLRHTSYVGWNVGSVNILLSTSQSYDRLGDNGGPSGPIEEIVAAQLSQPFGGPYSGMVPIGFIGGYYQSGIFDSAGNAGVIARRYSQTVVGLIADAEFREIERQAADKAKRRMRLLGGRQNEPSKRIPFGTIIHERWRYNPARIFGRYYLGHSSDWVPKAHRTATDDMAGYPFLIEEAFAVSIVQPGNNPRITMEEIPSILEAIKSDYSQLDIVVPVFVHYRTRVWLIYGDAGPFEVDFEAGTITH